ncbi:MAG: hypothetical protein J2P17_15205, partial [Mycobacterium sp.]|nr:hypothetical protein [Mycobacterium sp.]
IEKIEFANGSSWDLATINGNAWIRGTTGADSLSGFNSNDTIFGDLGNDTLNGGNGNDIYVYRSGDGSDTIAETVNSSGDTLRLTNLNAADVLLRHANNDLFIHVNATGEEIKVTNHFGTTNRGIEKIEFANGASWDLATINANAPLRGTDNAETLNGSSSADVMDGMGGNDTLNGGNGDDTLTGGLGNDTLTGEVGSDVYVYRSGDGADTISDVRSETVPDGYGWSTYYYGGGSNELDVLRLTDLNASDVTLRHSGNDLYVKVNANGQEIRVVDQFRSTYWGIEKIEFANGSSWDQATINANAWIRGTTGADTFNGSAVNDVFFGDLGNDTLTGQVGSDVYIYRSGDGSDTISDVMAVSGGDGYSSWTDYYGGASNEIDVLRLTDLNASDVTLRRSGNDLYVKTNATGQEIRVVDQFNTSSPYYWGIEKIEFANGSSWDLATINANTWIRGTTGNDTITGFNSNDNIFGDAGNDTLNGGNGNDVLSGWSGDDTLNGGSGNDWLDGGAGIDLLTGGSGDDGYYITDTTDTVTEAANGGWDHVDTTLASYTLGNEIEGLYFRGAGAFAGTGNALANVIAGGAGDDNLYGGLGNDTLDGGAGNDWLNGGAGADTLLGGAGDDGFYIDDTGNSVIEFAGDGSDHVNTTLGSYTLDANVEGLYFSGTGNFAGTGNALDNWIISGAGNDTLIGGAGNDWLEGGAGADSMSGGVGDDAYVVTDTGDTVTELTSEGWDSVHTTLASYTLGENMEGLYFTGTGSFTGLGNALDNWLAGGSGNDTLQGGLGNDGYMVSNAGDVLIELEGQGWDSVHTTLSSYTLGANFEGLYFDGTSAFTGLGNALDNWIVGGSGNDALMGDNGNDHLFGNEGNDQLYGGAGHDVLEGGAGNDALTGDSGNDTFVFHPGFGADTVTTFADGTDEDMIEFSTSIFANFAAVQAASAQVGTDVVIAASPTDTVTLKNYNLANLGADDFRFT